MLARQAKSAAPGGKLTISRVSPPVSTANITRLESPSLSISVREGDLGTFSLDGEMLSARELTLDTESGALSLRVGDGWGLGNYRALDSTGSQQALVVPVTEALVTSLRTAVDATWASWVSRSWCFWRA